MAVRAQLKISRDFRAYSQDFEADRKEQDTPVHPNHSVCDVKGTYLISPEETYCNENGLEY